MAKAQNDPLASLRNTGPDIKGPMEPPTSAEEKERKALLSSITDKGALLDKMTRTGQASHNTLLPKSEEEFMVLVWRTVFESLLQNIYKNGTNWHSISVQRDELSRAMLTADLAVEEYVKVRQVSVNMALKQRQEWEVKDNQIKA